MCVNVCAAMRMLLSNALEFHKTISIHKKKTGDLLIQLYLCGSTILLFFACKTMYERRKINIEGMLCVYLSSLSPSTSALHTQSIAHYELIYCLSMHYKSVTDDCDCNLVNVPISSHKINEFTCE